MRSSKHGSGFRIGGDLVVTALHVLNEGVEIADSGMSTWWPAEELWRNTELDAALLLLDREHDLGPVLPVRWGVLASETPRLPVEVQGFPRFLTDTGQDEPWGFEQADGHINPASTSRHGAMHVNVDSKTFTIDPHQWPGISGGPVLCHGAVIGLTQRAGAQRLVAMPIEHLLRDSEFRDSVKEHLGEVPPLEAVDLAGIAPGPVRPPRSPLGLLRPVQAALPYIPRGDELIDLYTWATKPGLDVRLVHGPTGSGKTRLAHELVRAVNGQGGAALFVDDIDTLRPTAMDSLQRLTRLTRPTLVVVDYAETKPDLVILLLESLVYNEPERPVKLLLLARSTRGWWSLLRRRSGNYGDVLLDAEVSHLTAAPMSPEQGDKEFDRVLDALVSELAALPNYSDHDWASAVGYIAAVPYAETGMRVYPMDCQVDALTALLEAEGLSPADHGSTLEMLLGHEHRYWRQAARQSGWNVPDTVLNVLLVLVNLYGAQNRADAVALLKRCTGLDDEKVLRFIAGFFDIFSEGSDSGHFWSPVRPGVLAEYLVLAGIREDPTLLTATLPHVREYQAVHALVLLSRAAPMDVEVWSWVATAVAKHKHVLPFDLLAGAAIAAPDPRGIIDALKASHEKLRPDQKVVLSAIAGEVVPEEARRHLWSLYLQAYSSLPDAGLRRAANRAAGVTEILALFAPELTNAVDTGIEVLPLVSETLRQLYKAATQLNEGYYDSGEHVAHRVNKVHGLVHEVLEHLNELTVHRRVFDSSLRPLDELSALLHELVNEVAESRARLKDIVNWIDPNAV
ncbi:trypsin-like peptidase domain-containing protein [Actinosynnema sp. NPDC050801]|uniref:trypsin-like peptidase domain-containing protein n=1 Tax=unclassified Actinosynnema TaxID=2637065 RepID=UPI0033F73CB1